MFPLKRLHPATWFIALVLILAVGIALSLISWRYPRLWTDLLLIPLLLIGYHYRNSLSRNLRYAYLGLLALVIVVFIGMFLQSLVALTPDPPEFDFKLYWTYGRASALGLNPYMQDNLLQLAAPLNVSDSFTAELFFFQTPPSLFLYAPLGWFDINTAFVVWFLAQMAVLGGVIFLLWKLFLPEDGYEGLLLTAAITVMAFGTLSTLRLGQVNFVEMLFLLLFWQDRRRPRAGIWLALAVFVKPVALFLFLYLLARRHWRAIAASIVTMAVASLLTMLVYGPEMLFDYFVANPIVDQMPDYLYTEMINQSLLAAILRLTQADLSTGSPLMQPLFLVIAAILTLVTGFLVNHSDEQGDEWALALTVFFALLVFPKTLSHYNFLTLAPLMLLWSRRHQFVGYPWSIAAFITLFALIVSNNGGRVMTWGLLLGWLFFSGVVTWLVARRPTQALQMATTA